LQKIGIRQIIGKRSPPAKESEVALAQLFEQWYPKVYNYLRYRINNPTDAEDLTSLVFERAYNARQQFDETKGAFSTWLFRIARNALIDHLRSGQRRATWEDEATLPLDLAASEPTLEAQVVQQELVATLLSSLARLSDRDQEIISLKFAGGFKNKEIGQIVGMKEKTVSVTLLRAMRRLRQQMMQEVAP